LLDILLITPIISNYLPISMLDKLKFNLCNSSDLIYSIELFVTPEIARSTPGFIAGFITGLIVGGALALGFKLLIEWTGSDGIWYKALGYGAVMWFLWVGLGRNFLNVAMYLSGDLQTNLVLLNQSLLYSVATAYFMIKIAGGRENLERPK